MLKGHVFKQQIFGNQIFALFINTFLNGANGISNNYKNGMAITYNGSTLTVQSGAVCIQGRFLEEDTSTDVSAGTDMAYCKLVIEIDLDKQNTDTEFVQGSYKIVKSASGYPNLTQQDIAKNNSGVYQYELARFKTSTSGITDFTDTRTFLDFDSIYSAIKAEYRTILEQLQQELASVEDGSAYVLKNNIAVIEGEISLDPSTEGPTNETYNSVLLDFPEEYNNTNCVCLEIGLKILNTNGYAYGLLNPADPRSWTRDSLYKNVILGDKTDSSKIRLTVANPTADTKTVYYKIVLLKTN